VRAAIVVLCLIAASANAQPASEPKLSAPDTSKVEALFEQGTKHYDVGEYDQAIATFKQAYALMPDPSFLFNIGQAYRQQKNCREARAAYKSYLRNAPDEDRPKTEQFIAEMDACVKLEEERARRLAPPPPPPPPEPPRNRKQRIAGLITAGAGAALIGGGVFFTARSLSASDEVERTCRDVCNGSDVAALDQQGRDDARNATILYAVGGAAVATGAALIIYAVVHREHVTVAPAAGGAIVSTTVRF
jgi:tetratricopeptide (TPR) repeat protein